jgi:SpoVK/Ycf46/Vps4 family AAA+-type ATPase
MEKANLFVSGPPGVGKTLTAEGLAEHLKRPLYIVCYILMMLLFMLTLQVSAGDLSNDAQQLEIQLSSIFELADCWNALLLLDEADVYLRARSSDHVHNSLVSVFLRKLEYYQGIMFLTTNRVTDFDEAMQSRIHLTLKYSTLNLATRKGIWTSFLKMAETLKGEAICAPKELEELAEKPLNGREVSLVSRESSK